MTRDAVVRIPDTRRRIDYLAWAACRVPGCKQAAVQWACFCDSHLQVLVDRVFGGPR